MRWQTARGSSLGIAFWSGLLSRLTSSADQECLCEHGLRAPQPRDRSARLARADGIRRGQDAEGSESDGPRLCPDHSGMVFPGQTEGLDFTALKEPGDYDFVCTVPGHWRLIKGVMTVEKK